jgi:hypothetical protein
LLDIDKDIVFYSTKNNFICYKRKLYFVI